MGEQQCDCLFLTETEDQETLCLRPEFTIPVCLEHIKCETPNHRRYVYFDKSFRKVPPNRNGILQAGLVDLDDPDYSTADARSITDAYALLELTMSRRELVTTIGDLGILEAVLTALELPRRWRRRLIRGPGARLPVSVASANVEQPRPEKKLDYRVRDFVARADLTAITAYVANVMTRGGVSPAAGRTPHEIATRLIESAELANTRLSQSTFDVLNSFLSICAPLDRALDQIAGFARSTGLTLGTGFDDFFNRAEALEREGVPLSQLTYDASFSRRLGHHTGLLFEIREPGSERILASGGRYDRLPALLGANRPIPTLGLSVFIDELKLPSAN